MNTMTHAIKTAGIPIPPANKRIWLWLKDHPEKTGGEIAKAIGMKDNNVSALCGNMVQRGLMKVIELPRVVTSGYGSAERLVLHYSVDPKMRGVFELLPAPKKVKTANTVQPVKDETPKAALAPAPYDFKPASAGFPVCSNIVLDEGAENALHTCAEQLRNKLGFNVTPSQTVLWLVNNARL